MDGHGPEPELRSAVKADAPALHALARAAYAGYVECIGGEPRPMNDDYAEVIGSWDVTVGVVDGEIVGLLVCGEDHWYGGFAIDNVAVADSWRGRGLGRALLELAEDKARAAGHDEIRLLAHETMTENLALYARAGYVEFDRRPVGSGHLVLMRKPLPGPRPSAGLG